MAITLISSFPVQQFKTKHRFLVILFSQVIPTKFFLQFFDFNIFYHERAKNIEKNENTCFQVFYKVLKLSWNFLADIEVRYKNLKIFLHIWLISIQLASLQSIIIMDITQFQASFFGKAKYLLYILPVRTKFGPSHYNYENVFNSFYIIFNGLVC